MIIKEYFEELREIEKTDREIDEYLSTFIKRLYKKLDDAFPVYDCSSDERIAATRSMLYFAAKGAVDGLKKENVTEALSFMKAQREAMDAKILAQVQSEVGTKRGRKKARSEDEGRIK